MNGQFRFTLDDFFVLENDPKGWDESKIVVKRNDAFGGLFIEYITELEFFAEAYGYINTQIESLGYCFSVKVTIEYRCNNNSGYESVFVGYMNISRAKIDQLECTIKANLELDNIYADFLNSADRQIVLSPAPTVFPNGEIVSANFQTISYHNVETGDNTLNKPTDNRALAIQVINVLDYLTKIITEGELTVVSDFFSSTEAKTNKWDIELQGVAMKSGDRIYLTYRNLWGHVVTKSALFSGNEITTLTLLAFAAGDYSDTTGISGTSSVCNFFMHYGFSYGAANIRTLRLYSWIPIEIISVTIDGTGPTTTADFQEIEAYQQGGRELYLSSQLNEVFNSQIWPLQALTNSKVSFRQVYDELCSFFNLGMQLEGTPGNYIVRIEPMEYFYNIDSQIQITDVDQIQTTFETGSAFKQINIENNLGLTGTAVDYTLFTQTGSITVGTDAFTFTPSSSIVSPSVNDYIWSPDSQEVFRVIAVGSGTVTTDRNALYTVTTGNWFILGYQQVKAAAAWVNEGMSANIGSCIGDVLELNNRFITEIEKHGDQTTAFFPPNKGISAGADRDSITLLQVNPNTLKTLEYPYFLTSTSGPSYFRTAFNGHLTNHHKIIGNALRIKYDCSIIAPSFSEPVGYLLTYPNSSSVKPTRIHEFDYYLSFTDIQTIIQNPAQTLELEIKGELIRCWIQEVEFDINTKQTHFKLIENL